MVRANPAIPHSAELKNSHDIDTCNSPLDFYSSLMFLKAITYCCFAIEFRLLEGTWIEGTLLRN
jgi:hypothetical protein